MTEKGLVATNKVGWASDLVPHLKRLGVKRIQALIFDTPEEQVPDLLAAQAAVPGLGIVARIHAENIVTFNPEEWAEECVRRVLVLVRAGVNIIAVIPCNEPNIEAPEELREDWDYQVDWYTRFSREWHLLTLGRGDSSSHLAVDLDLPALSPTGNWLAGLDAYEHADLHDLFDRFDAHCYPGSETAYRQVMARFPDRPVSVTEFNGIDPASFLAGLPEDVEDAYWFIWRWENPPEGSPDVDLAGSEYEQSFSLADNIPDEGGTMDLEELFPDLFNAWVEAGGIHNNFRKHLLGVGAVPAVREDLDFLVDEAASGLAQLRGTLDAFLA